jgi:hypothetical protein
MMQPLPGSNIVQQPIAVVPVTTQPPKTTTTIKPPHPRPSVLHTIEKFLQMETQKVETSTVPPKPTLSAVPTKVFNNQSIASTIPLTKILKKQNSTEASKIYKPSSPTTNISKTNSSTNIAPIPKKDTKVVEMKEKIDEIIKIIDPKIKKLESDESNSLESSDSEESQEDETVPFDLYPNAINGRSSYPKPQTSTQPARVSNYKPYHKSAWSPFSNPSFNSLVDTAHTYLFSSRRVAPLPTNPLQYVPTAHKHAYQESRHQGRTKRTNNHFIPVIARTNRYPATVQQSPYVFYSK